MKDFIYLKESEHTGSLEPAKQTGEVVTCKYKGNDQSYHIKHKPDVFQLPPSKLDFIRGRKSFRLFAANVKKAETIALPELVKGNSDIIPPHTLHEIMKWSALGSLSNMRQAKMMMIMFIIAGIGIGCLIGFVTSQMFLPHEITLAAGESIKTIQPSNIAPLIGGGFFNV